MTATPDEDEGSPALTALTELGRDAVEPHTRADLDEAYRALRKRFVAGQVRRRALVCVTVLGAAAACVALAFRIPAMRSQRAPAPEPAVAVARIEGGDLLEGGYLSQSGRAGVTVIFNEGAGSSSRAARAAACGPSTPMARGSASSTAPRRCGSRPVASTGGRWRRDRSWSP